MNANHPVNSLTIAAALDVAGARLAATHTDSAGLDAEVLLAHTLNKPRSHLRAWPEQVLLPQQQQDFFVLIDARAAGRPVAYLTGRREFWSLNLRVNSDTLIPRPDTERLVELALERIPADRDYCIADIGTGSGAIALAIASERPRCRVIATDISPRALAIATHNAHQLDLSNLNFREGDGVAALHGERVDMICSNPPYLAEDDPHLLDGDISAEPRGALVAGPTGLEMLEQLARTAPAHLREAGWLLLEHGYQQGAAVAELLTLLHYRCVRTFHDYADQPRITLGQRG
ncbi:MAG: peptide chain release factor N(5)-glutamine methyltransferase [Pseudomonadota bacterium]